MYKNHWVTNISREQHPMFGTKRPECSVRMIQWNQSHSGPLSPTWGLKRPDLAARNKANGRPIRCICTNTVYPSIAEAERILGKKLYSLSRRIKKGWKAAGYYWEYVTEDS